MIGKIIEWQGEQVKIKRDDDTIVLLKPQQIINKKGRRSIDLIGKKGLIKSSFINGKTKTILDMSF